VSTIGWDLGKRSRNTAYFEWGRLVRIIPPSSMFSREKKRGASSWSSMVPETSRSSPIPSPSLRRGWPSIEAQPTFVQDVDFGLVAYCRFEAHNFHRRASYRLVLPPSTTAMMHLSFAALAACIAAVQALREPSFLFFAF